MEYVEPIRDKRQIEAVKKYLKGSGDLRSFALFVLGINSGLRVSDLLALKIGDVADSRGRIRGRLTVIEQKTGKRKDFPLGQNAAKGLAEYLATRPNAKEHEPLFPGRGGKSLSRKQAWTILHLAARSVGIQERIGTHTLRKTFAYHCYVEGKDLSLVTQLLNHSSPAHTLRYIGVSRDQMDRAYLSINL